MIKNKLNEILNILCDIKQDMKFHNIEYSQAFININKAIKLLTWVIDGIGNKPIRQLGIGIRSTEDPADRDDRLYHEEQDIIAMDNAKENN